MTVLDTITPDWPAAPRVKALSTLRIGGVSKAAYCSLNLGDHVGDDAQCVASNRAILQTKADLPQQPAWLDQTHSTDLVELFNQHNRRFIKQPLSGDASITGDADQICVVLTADCLPVLLTDQQGLQVAAVHAGWRGMAGGIIERVIAQFNAPADELLAWLGPCIGPTAFEVGLEVMRALGGPEMAYKPHPIDDHKVYANLAMLAKKRLAASGVRQCFGGDECTYSDPERFFSYRRDGQTGRMATLIWREG